MAGKKHLTEEHKRKIGEANKGKKSCKPCHTSLHFSRGDINRWLIRSQGSE